MNKRNYPFSELNVWLNNKNNFHIFLPLKPNLDQVASACTLASSLTRSGKKTQVVSQEQMKVAFNEVYGVDRVRQKIEGRSFVVDINYPFQKVEKINWDDQVEDKVRLIIKSQEGAETITADMVQFSRRGGKAENVIAFAFANQQKLKAAVNAASEGKATDLQVVNINRQEGEFFGQVKVVDRQAISYAEIVASLIEGLSLPFGKDEANNLLLGLQAATDSFSSSHVSADAFEAAAFCLRAGGQLHQGRHKETKFRQPKIYRGTSE